MDFKGNGQNVFNITLKFSIFGEKIQMSKQKGWNCLQQNGGYWLQRVYEITVNESTGIGLRHEFLQSKRQLRVAGQFGIIISRLICRKMQQGNGHSVKWDIYATTGVNFKTPLDNQLSSILVNIELVFRGQQFGHQNHYNPTFLPVLKKFKILSKGIENETGNMRC